MKHNYKKSVVIDYSALQACDIVLCGGAGLFGAAIRFFTGGRFFKSATNPLGVTHAGLIVQWEGQAFIAEMKPGGLEINSLEEYNRADRRHFIAGVFRARGLTAKQQEQISRGVAVDRRKTIEYDWKGDANFVFKAIPGSPAKYFCSEYVADVFAKVANIVIKGTGKTAGASGVSPADIQRWALVHCDEVSWFK